jgi:endoplasmic reticulum junction formation protein lunapark
LRRTVKWWYSRAIGRESHEKELLQTRLDEKIEELKEKSDYYNTRQLLERYDSKSAKQENTENQQNKVRSSRQLEHSSSDTSLDRSLEASRPPPLSSPLIPPLPPPITPSSFTLPSQSIPNIPQFHPSAFTPPSSPLPLEAQPKTFIDRLLDLLAGEDENAPGNRFALICRHCRAHNGLAPPGETGDELGYLCGRCGEWNGPRKRSQQSEFTEVKEDVKSEPAKVEEKLEKSEDRAPTDGETIKSESVAKVSEE